MSALGLTTSVNVASGNSRKWANWLTGAFGPCRPRDRRRHVPGDVHQDQRVADRRKPPRRYLAASLSLSAAAARTVGAPSRVPDASTAATTRAVRFRIGTLRKNAVRMRWVTRARPQTPAGRHEILGDAKPLSRPLSDPAVNLTGALQGGCPWPLYLSGRIHRVGWAGTKVVGGSPSSPWSREDRV